MLEMYPTQHGIAKLEPITASFRRIIASVVIVQLRA